MTDSPWLTVGLVLAWKKDQDESAGSETDAPALQLACDAVAEFVEAKRAEFYVNGTFQPSATVKLGAVMYAARLHERRTTLLGVAGFGDLGTSPILRYDPDISRLLGLDGEGGFAFGAGGSRESVL